MWPVYLHAAAMLSWLALLAVPWRPWGTRESLDIDRPCNPANLSDITVLIPARNEAESITDTLASLKRQGEGLEVIMVDDQSSDDTVKRAEQSALEALAVIPGEPLPAGWSGKLWALEQGYKHVRTEYTLLLDADICLQTGIIAVMRTRMQQGRIDFLSLMASLRMRSGWEKLLIPAFIYFFKLVYPFRLSNSAKYPWLAAAAGGCILLKTRLLHELGGFGSLCDALIDDCTLARRIKSHGYRTWIGLTHSAVSTRAYDRLGPIWQMVARNAYTQLKYSLSLLLVVTVLMLIMFVLPFTGLLVDDIRVRAFSLVALVLMVVSYLPVLRYYRQPMILALALPVIALFYLAMTWSSALRYWRGVRSRWKSRVYGKNINSDTSI